MQVRRIEDLHFALYALTFSSTDLHSATTLLQQQRQVARQNEIGICPVPNSSTWRCPHQAYLMRPHPLELP
eukprot:1832906-Amphidinium_carterae.3